MALKEESNKLSLEFLDANNVITRYYVHGAGLLAAITPADSVYCYHYDGVGNTVAITDGSETVVNSYDYSPFGMIISENETFPQPFKFVGKLGVMAESNGFYYMRARYYDPVIGRFISEDPLAFDGGDVNLYVYGSNNPVLMVDPWGLDWVSTGLGVGSYVLNTAGLATANPYVKVAGIAVSSAAIIYSEVQTHLGNMTRGEAARNQALAVADITGASVGGTAGILISTGSRALGIANTAHDAVMSANQRPTVSQTPEISQQISVPFGTTSSLK